MFGFSGGESAETVARKRGYMAEARERWPFITLFDASTTAQTSPGRLSRHRRPAPTGERGKRHGSRWSTLPAE